ncbi:SPOSA6832_02301, partial [Sporobolomyces salmonicolor]
MNYLTPFVTPGYEPPQPDPVTGELRPKTEDERREIISQMKQIRLVQEGMESPVTKAAISGAMGFAIGAFFSLMGSSFTIEDPFRAQQYDGMKTAEKAKLIFKDMGKGMWRQGMGFGKVGALYAGTECVVEGVSRALPRSPSRRSLSFRPLPSLSPSSRFPPPPPTPLSYPPAPFILLTSPRSNQFRAKNDIYNSVYAGLISGAVLARNSGPRAMVLGGMGFAAFSAVIDSYLRRETADEDA